MRLFGQPTFPSTGGAVCARSDFSSAGGDSQLYLPRLDKAWSLLEYDLGCKTKAIAQAATALARAGGAIGAPVPAAPAAAFVKIHTGNIGQLGVFIADPIGVGDTGATDATWRHGRRIGPRSRGSFCARKRQLVVKLHGRKRKSGGRGTGGKKMHLRQLSGSIAVDSLAAAALTGVLVLERSAPQNPSSGETVPEFQWAEIHSAASRHSSSHGVREGRKTWGAQLSGWSGSAGSRFGGHLYPTAQGRPLAPIGLPPLLRFGGGGGGRYGEAAR